MCDDFHERRTTHRRGCRRRGTAADRLTTADLILLATGADYWSTVAVPDAGLRALRLADGPYGLRVQDDDNPDHLGLGRSLAATCFPPAVTMASSWDRGPAREVGIPLGREARAAGVDMVLGPGMNLKRSPLCGRNFAYISEDPLHGGLLAAAMVDGLQILIIESRRGIRGRMADLLSDKTGRGSVLGVPLQSLVSFRASPSIRQTSATSWSTSTQRDAPPTTVVLHFENGSPSQSSGLWAAFEVRLPARTSASGDWVGDEGEAGAVG